MTGCPCTLSFTVLFSIFTFMAGSFAEMLVSYAQRERGFHRDSIQYGDFYHFPAVWVDKGQLQQVVINLLANAIKFADPGKLKVIINANQMGSELCLYFTDYGPGVEAGFEKSIFQPYVRTPQAMLRDVSGQGIGLSVVRAIVRAHGGEISLTSRQNPTRLRIALPNSLRLNPPSGARVNRGSTN